MKKRKKPQMPKFAEKPKPILEWQTGDYKRHAKFRFSLPYQFLLLCKLMNTTPNEILSDFMDNLSCSSWKREGRDRAKAKLIEYFIEHGYGQQQYSIDDITMIFREMDAIGILFPKDADSEMMNTHSKWRESYHTYWFDKWYNKFNRR